MKSIVFLRGILKGEAEDNLSRNSTLPTLLSIRFGRHAPV
jgi:hypothetical protein